MTKLFHVSDVHFGAEDPAAIAWFGERVAAEKPDAVIMTGDLTMRAKPDEFQAGGDWLRSLGVPVTLEVGNHDIPYYWDPLRRLFSPYSRYAAVEKMIERPLDIQGIAVIPLKTTARAVALELVKGTGELWIAQALIVADRGRAEGSSDHRGGAPSVDRGADQGNRQDEVRRSGAGRAGGGGGRCGIVRPRPRSVRRTVRA